MKRCAVTLGIMSLITVSSLSGKYPDTVMVKDSNHEDTKIFMLQTSKRDRLYWGPEIFWETQSSKIKNTHLKDHSAYYGLRLGYDFFRPSAVYAGTDFLYALGRMHLRTAPDSKVQVYKDKSTATFARAEMRLGYNFHEQGRFYLTPFFGLGGYHIRPQSVHYVQNGLYAAVGMKIDYDWLHHLNIGLNLKGTRALYLEQRMTKKNFSVSTHHTSNVLGYEVSLPITVRLGESRCWDICLEPYYLKLNSVSNANMLGGKMNFSCRF